MNGNGIKMIGLVLMLLAAACGSESESTAAASDSVEGNIADLAAFQTHGKSDTLDPELAARLQFADSHIPANTYPRDTPSASPFAELNWTSDSLFGSAPFMAASYTCVPGRTVKLTAAIDDPNREEFLQGLTDSEFRDDPNEFYSAYLTTERFEVLDQAQLKRQRRRESNSWDWSVSESYPTAVFDVACETAETVLVVVQRHTRTRWATVWFEESAARWNDESWSGETDVLALHPDAQRQLLNSRHLEKAAMQHGPALADLSSRVGIDSSRGFLSKLMLDGTPVGYHLRIHEDGEEQLFNLETRRVSKTRQTPDGTFRTACWGEDCRSAKERPRVDVRL